ncbi:FecR family protein [Chitinophaga niastensis]|uniref:FecR family protein n=1 Tax=Chitinophaga niastensis TaxID=536980 RepID=A0A2P8HQ11_CHINA|nr:FecR family protein [Chitinophaga niastensis]PSL48311.1 FecR family protein [Chitinophaga niastensis]
MDSNIDIKILEKYLDGTASPEEQQLIEAWLAEGEDHAPLFEDEDSQEAMQYRETAKAAVLEKLYETDAISKPGRNRRIILLRVAVAASIMAAIVMTATWFQHHITESHIRNPVSLKGAMPYKSRNKAVLELSGGRTIALDAIAAGQTLQDGAVTITKTANNEIEYQQVAAGQQQPVGIHKLSVPKSSQYIVVLSDGTKVWLNAGSTISFPAAFTGNSRDVAITGEAYFEVAKQVAANGGNYQPFSVATGKMSVLVLGTHFNINAYTDEPAVSTTLLEGSVQVKVNKQKIQIRPGEQAQLNNTGKLSVSQPNLEEIVAWQKGYLQFDNTPLEEVFRQIARWYDVHVVFKGGVHQGSFHGKIYPGMKLPEILRGLETNGARFTFNGTSIIVE